MKLSDAMFAGLLCLTALLYQACGADGSSPPPCQNVCTLGETECVGSSETRVCLQGGDNCPMWEVRSCSSGSETCQNGSCVSTCPNGCCPACEPLVCGPGSTDGCGGTCGDAVAARNTVASVVDALCAVTMPCCESGSICSYDTLTECKEWYTREFLGDESPHWCEEWVERCIADLSTWTCDKLDMQGLPAACTTLAETTFTVVPAADGSCVDEGERHCGDLGQCVDVLANDMHCGNCNTECWNEQTCVDGACQDCGGAGQPCCEDSQCRIGICEMGSCVLRVCEQPLIAPNILPVCPLNCDDRTDYSTYFDCVYNYVGEGVVFNNCLSCIEQQAQLCAQGGECDEEIGALRCCMEDCVDQPFNDCRNHCGNFTAAYSACMKKTGCYAASPGKPVLDCFQ